MQPNQQRHAHQPRCAGPPHQSCARQQHPRRQRHRIPCGTRASAQAQATAQKDKRREEDVAAIPTRIRLDRLKRTALKEHHYPESRQPHHHHRAGHPGQLRRQENMQQDGREKNARLPIPNHRRTQPHIRIPQRNLRIPQPLRCIIHRALQRHRRIVASAENHPRPPPRQCRQYRHGQDDQRTSHQQLALLALRDGHILRSRHYLHRRHLHPF